MIIELVNTQLKATWPRYPKPTYDEIIRRLKTISGAEFDKVGRCWWIPVAQADRLVELFPRASFDYDAICAATDAQAGRVHAFYDSLVQMGVELQINDSGTIVAVGENVSPLIQSLVDERAAALRPLVVEAMENPRPKARPSAQPQEPMHGPYTADDARFGPLFKGVRNAAKKAEEDALKYPRQRWRKAKEKPLHP